MGLHQMFWIKREMVVKGREREKVHRRRVTHYPRCLAGSSLVILFQFPSALREREEYADVRQRAAASRTNVLGQGRPLCVLEFLEERRPQNPVSWYLLESGVYVDTLCYLEWMTTGDKVDTSVTTTTSFCFHFRLWRDVDAWWWRFLPFRNVVLFFLSSSRPRRSLNDAGLVLFCLVTLCDDVCLCLPLDLCAFFRRS